MNKNLIYVGRIAFFLTLLIVILSSIPNISASNITSLTSSEGSSYINWTWTKDYDPANPNLTTVGVWIDGDFVVNSNLNFFILSGLESRERHVISLVNATNSSEVFISDESMSLLPFGLYYLLLGLSFGFLLLELLFSKMNILCFIFGAICFFTSITTIYLSFTYFLSPFVYLMMCVCCISVVWLIGMAFVMVTERGVFE